MGKKRINIPETIATEIQFLSDRTCCVCNIRGNTIQLHHLDEDPSNNNIENIAVLCLECHAESQIKGGIGRKLDANQIKRYRHDWIQRVQERRKRADEIASIRSVTGTVRSLLEQEHLNVSDDYFTNDDPELLEKYLNEIIVVHKAQLTIAQVEWDSGVNSRMTNGSYTVIDFYSEVLIELATFYPKWHFNKQSPSHFFSELISSRFQWHRSMLEPGGSGTGGTIISTMAGGGVMDDLSRMIVDMVNALLFSYDLDRKIDFLNWKNSWLD